jgi:hypothetical protein
MDVKDLKMVVTGDAIFRMSFPRELDLILQLILVDG